VEEEKEEESKEIANESRGGGGREVYETGKNRRNGRWEGAGG
jgi:hypothetical protein